MLAVANDKQISTEALLRAGAKVDVRDSMKNEAIHEATAFIAFNSHSFEIIKLLLHFGADPNAVSKNGPQTVPLEGAVASLSCTKLLLENGANLYFQNKMDTTYHSYIVWASMLSNPLDSAIFVAKYMIVQEKMSVPNPITLSMGRHQPLDIFHFLKKLNFVNDKKKEEAKNSIINYLRSIDYPVNGVYK